MIKVAGGPITVQNYARKKLSRSISLAKKNIHNKPTYLQSPHALSSSNRSNTSHTHAAQLREEGIDIGIISKQLGHCSIATTARYLDHIAPYAVIEAIQRRRWRVKKILV